MDSLPLLTAVSHRWEADLAGKVDAGRLAHVVRRCADLAELVGTAEAGTGRLAIVSVDLRGLDREVVRRLGSLGVGVVGVHRPGDEEGARTLRRWGVGVVLAADADQAALEQALTEVVRPDAADPSHQPDRPPAARLSGGTSDAGDGTVVVVWGPPGAPGRTTVAVNLAAELASPATPTLLVDADTYQASVAQAVGVLDEAPGLLAAARAADQGQLDPPSLSRVAPELTPGLRVLTGVPRSDRWAELGDRALADVLEVARALTRWTVVDVAPYLEEDEELSFDTRAPRRNGATRTALEAADRVVVVGTADPVGLHRLVRAVDALGELGVATGSVVVTRLRSSAVGGPDPAARVREALQRFAGLTEVLLVPEDREALDAALLQGRTLCEARPDSPARTALRDLAADLSGQPRAARRRGRRWRRAGPA